MPAACEVDGAPASAYGSKGPYDGSLPPLGSPGTAEALPRRTAAATAVRTILGKYTITAAVAAGIAVLAYNRGAFGILERNSAAVVIWWAVALVLALHLWHVPSWSRAALVAGGALAGLTGLTFASATWAPSAETAVREGGRNVLYLGVFTLVVICAHRRDAARWCDGLALGIVAVLVLALTSRLFPGSIGPTEPFADLLGNASRRLSYPIGYWNALGILGALAVPPLLRLSLASRSAGARALALGSIPAVTSALFLTSSRTAVAAAAVGLVAFFALSAPRWPVVWRVVVALAGSAAATVVLLRHPVVVDGPLGTAEAADASGRVALLLAAICAMTAVAAAGLERIRTPGSLSGSAADRILVVGAAAVVVLGLAASDPVERFEAFKRPPVISERDPSYVQSHLLSTSGNARWQYWTVAVHEFEAHPLTGGGAGSFGSWWEEQRPVFVVSRDAHSLYFETLGELGLAGLAFVLIVVACGAVAGTRRALASSGRARTTVAATTASFLAFAVAAGLEWAWEIPVLGAVGVAFLALATIDRKPVAAMRPPCPRAVIRVGAVVVAAAVAVAAAIPIVAESHLERSRSAVARGDRARALEAADAARRIEPWNASAYTQLALLYEEEGELVRARRAIEGALERDRRSWTLWIVAMRIQTRLGDIAGGRASLANARRLNPFSTQSIGG